GTHRSHDGRDRRVGAGGGRRRHEGHRARSRPGQEEPGRAARKCALPDSSRPRADPVPDAGRLHPATASVNVRELSGGFSSRLSCAAEDIPSFMRLRLTKRFQRSVPDVYAWCTEFRDSDPELSRVRLRSRKVIRREGNLIEMEETGTMGFPFVAQYIVRLRPPDSWEADARSNMGRTHNTYKLFPDVEGTARNDFRRPLEGTLPTVRPVREGIHRPEDIAGVGRLRARNGRRSIGPGGNPRVVNHPGQAEGGGRRDQRRPRDESGQF